MSENIHPDPWRTRGDYDEDRKRMKGVMVAAIISSVAATISSIAAIIVAISSCMKCH